MASKKYIFMRDKFPKAILILYLNNIPRSLNNIFIINNNKKTFKLNIYKNMNYKILLL